MGLCEVCTFITGRCSKKCKKKKIIKLDQLPIPTWYKKKKNKKCLNRRFINGDDWVITEGLSMESETDYCF